MWEQRLHEKLTADAKARIVGCNAQMRTFSFYFGLSLGYKLYALTDNLSKTLQKEKMSSISGQRTANLTVQTLEGMRTEESFKLFFATVLKKAKQHPAATEPTLPRKRARPNYSTLQFVEGYGQGATAHHALTVDYHYKQIYFEAIDIFIASITERFNQPSLKTFAALEQMLLNVINNTSRDVNDGMTHLKATCGDDVNDASLLVEFGIWKRIFSNECFACFDDIHNKLKGLQHEEKLLIPNVIVVCKLLLVNPSTSATLRFFISTMGEDMAEVHDDSEAFQCIGNPKHSQRDDRQY